MTTWVRDGSDLNNFWERWYQAHGPSSATKALLCEPGHNLHFCIGLKDFTTRHKVKSKGRARWRNGGSPGSQLWHTGRVAADGIKYTAARNTTSNSAKKWKSSQHIGKCSKSKYMSYKSRASPPFEGSSIPAWPVSVALAHIDSCFHRDALWTVPLFLPCPSGLLFLCPDLCRPSSLASEEVLTAREARTVLEEPWDDAAAVREQHFRSRQAGPNFLFDAQRPGQLTKAPPGCPYRGNGLAFYPRCGSRTRTTRRVSTAGRKVPSDGL